MDSPVKPKPQYPAPTTPVKNPDGTVHTLDDTGNGEAPPKVPPKQPGQ